MKIIWKKAAYHQYQINENNKINEAMSINGGVIMAKLLKQWKY